MLSASVRGDPRGEKISSRGQDGELFSGGEFPVAIPTCRLQLPPSMTVCIHELHKASKRSFYAGSRHVEI
jgi:hypothetical protein